MAFRRPCFSKPSAVLKTLGQYGFTTTQTSDDGWLYADSADHSWMFGILVLEDEATRKLLCVSDQAETGGTYHGVSAVEVAIGPDGIWTSTGIRDHVPGCTGSP